MKLSNYEKYLIMEHRKTHNAVEDREFWAEISREMDHEETDDFRNWCLVNKMGDPLA